MIEFLRRFFISLLFLLRDNSGVDVTAMDPMNSDTDSDLDYNVPEIWEKRLRLDASRKSFFGSMKGGEGTEKPIIEVERFVNEPGDVIRNVSHLKNLENCWNTLRASTPTYGKVLRIGQSADKGAKEWMN